MKVPPTVGMRPAKRSTTSVDGVIGYPAAKRAPAAIAPSQQAWSPSTKWTPVRTPFGSAFIPYFSGFPGFGLDLGPGNGEVRAVHAAQVTATAFLGFDNVRRVVSLRVEGGRKC